ncbi:fumarylacetoacetate hydrolase family protein [Corynebacterium propinquum]
MRLASVATPDGDRYVAIVDDAESRNFLDSAAVTVRPLHGFSAAQTPVRNVGELLAIPGWREHLNEALIESGDPVDIATSELDTVIPWPGKIICQGLNYAEHILEMGRDLPDYPTLFTKYPEALARPYADVEVPADKAAQLDFEGELAVIIGDYANEVSPAEAKDYIAGYAVFNDYTLRDAQRRTPQWHQGKSFRASSGFGPWLTTPDEFDFSTASLRTYLNDELMQEAPLADQVFPPAELISFISQIYPLRPGDVIATGTPDGVGFARTPQRFIRDGETVTITIDGLGTIANTTRITHHR